MKRVILATWFLFSANNLLSQEIPTFDTMSLANGLKVYLLKYGEEKQVSIKLLIDAGRKNENKCEVGYSEIICGMLSGAVKEKKDLLIKNGTKPNCEMANGQTLISDKCAIYDLHKEITALSSALTRLMFTTEKMDPLVSAIGEKYLPENLRLAQLCELFKDKTLYTAESALGRSYCQYQIQRVVPEKLREFYLSHYIPDEASLVICGNINVKEVKRIIGKNFVTWKTLRKQLEPTAEITSEIPAIKGKQNVFINKVEAKSYLLKWIQPAPAFNSSQYPAFLVASELFQDFLKEKIMQSTDTIKSGSVIYGNGSIETECTTSACGFTGTIKLIDSAFKLFRRFKLNDADLQDAVEKLKSKYLALRTPGEIISFYDPLTYEQTSRVNYLSSLSGVGLSDVESVLKNYFDPDVYRLIIVGKEHTISSQLNSLTNLSRYETSDFESCDDACREIVIIKCHCESCYRRGYCNVWRFDPDQKNSIKNAKSRAKFTVK